MGRMTHANGDLYEGEWKEDMAHGYGTFLDTKGASYKGYWIKDQQHGQGVESWDNGRTRY